LLRRTPQLSELLLKLKSAKTSGPLAIESNPLAGNPPRDQQRGEDERGQHASGGGDNENSFHLRRRDTWTPDGESIVEHVVAGSGKFGVARLRITEAGWRYLEDWST
jgi:hypothetical protein